MLGRFGWHFTSLLILVLVGGFLVNYNIKVVVHPFEPSVRVNIVSRNVEDDEAHPPVLPSVPLQDDRPLEVQKAHHASPAPSPARPPKKVALDLTPLPSPSPAAQIPQASEVIKKAHGKADKSATYSSAVTVELQYDPKTCKGHFTAIPKDCSHPKGFLGDVDVEKFVSEKFGPNDYRFLFSGPELVAAGHVMVDPTKCITHHPFVLGTAGLYKVSAQRLSTRYKGISQTPIPELLNTESTLRCTKTVKKRSVRCNSTSQGRWVGDQWLGLGCTFPTLDPANLRGRSFVLYGDRPHRALFSTMVDMVREVMHPGLELPGFLHGSPWIDMGRIAGRRVLSVTIVIRDPVESNVSSRVSWVMDPAAVVTFDGFYNYFSDEESRLVKKRAKVFTSRGMTSVTQGAVGPNTRWENRSKWSDGKFPPVQLYTAHLYGFTHELFRHVPVSFIAKQLRAVQRLLETKADLIDSQMYWLFIPQDSHGNTTAGSLLARLGNLYTYEALRPADTLRFIDIFAMTAALPAGAFYNSTFAQRIVEYLLGEIMADVLSEEPVVMGETSHPELLPLLPPPPPPMPSPPPLPPPAPPKYQNLDSVKDDLNLRPLRPSLHRLWQHQASAEEQELLRSSVIHHRVTGSVQRGFHIVLMWVDKAYTWTIVGIYDTNGTLVASKRAENRLWVAEFMNSTTMYSMYSMGDTSLDINRRNGVWIWNIETDVTHRIQLRGCHHMIEFDPLHQTWLTLQQSNARLWAQGVYSQVQVDDIWEFDMAGNPVWKWYARAHLPYYTNMHRMNANPNRDFVHANTLHYDVHEGVIYYNSRHMDTVWKIDKATGKCIWAIGRYGDVPMYTEKGEPHQLFSHSHGLTRVDDDTFVTFDNDAWMAKGFITFCTRSRLLEFRYDAKWHTANVTWKWTGERNLCRQVQGGTMRFPNGNTLGCFGKGWEIEVDRAGHIAWSMQIIGNLTRVKEFPPPHDFNIGSRYLYTPYVRITAQPTCASRQLRLSVWNAFRHESKMGGFLTVWAKDPDAHSAPPPNIVLRRPFDFRPHWFETQLGITVPMDHKTLWLTIENEDGLRAPSSRIAIPHGCGA